MLVAPSSTMPPGRLLGLVSFALAILPWTLCALLAAAAVVVTGLPHAVIISPLVPVAYVAPCALPIGMAAVLTGHLARRQLKSAAQPGGGLTAAGLVIGYVDLALGSLGVWLWLTGYISLVIATVDWLFACGFTC